MKDNGVMKMQEDLNEHMRVRRDKLETDCDEGLVRFGGKFGRVHLASDVMEKYDGYSKEDLDGMDDEVTIAGRLMTKRGKGKAGFAHIQDVSDQIQLYVRKDEI